MKTIELLPTLRSLLGGATQVTSKSWADRSVILQPQVNLFCWSRNIDSTVESYMQTQIDQDVPSLELTISLDSYISHIAQARKKWIGANGLTGDRFWEDVELLAGDFLRLTESKSCKFNLGIVKSDACTKFHTDSIRYRLLTTYAGPGTEWLPEKSTNRKALGKCNDQIVKDTSHIRHLETFDVGILKGESPNKVLGTKGIVHRSPSIETEGSKRIVLRIDA